VSVNGGDMKFFWWLETTPQTAQFAAHKR